MKSTTIVRALSLLLLCGFISACSQAKLASNDQFPDAGTQSSVGSIRPINLMDF